MTTFHEWQTELSTTVAQSAEQGFAWQGRVCALLPPQAEDPELAQWCVHLGPAPADGSAEPWLNLLAWQLGAAGRLPVVLGADRSSRELLLTQSLPWQAFAPEDALAVLTMVVLAADELQALLASEAKPLQSATATRSSLDLLMRRQGGSAGSPR